MSEPDIEWVEVPGGGELWEGDLLDAEVEGEEILLVHLLGGERRAFQGVCPHQEILLADGTWNEETGTLTCSGHNWEFDLKTGKGINPAGCSLYEYPLRCSDDTVELGLKNDGRSRYHRFASTEGTP